MPDIADTFRRALVSTDQAYLTAEHTLRQAPDAIESLPADVVASDPLGPLLAAVVHESATGPDFDQVTRFLDDKARRAARTAARVPKVMATVNQLSHMYGGRLAEFLAMRLARETMPRWRAMTALAYLDQHKTPKATDAIIQFAARTQARPLQEAAAVVLSRGGDPDLRRKLAAAGTLPPALTRLA